MDQPQLSQEEYAEWTKGQQEVVRELCQALQGGDVKEQQLAEIVERAAQHYFSAPIYSLYSSPLMSPLERAFMWLGGMRPSLSFQLIYALTGHQIQAELEEFLELGDHHDAADGQAPLASLASLSASQMAQLSDLQTYSVQEEDRVEREIAKLQRSAADHPLILQVVGSGSSSSSAPSDDDIHRSIDSAISKKLASWQEICMEANSLRLSTLRRVLDLLHNPLQKAQYLLAAAKLQVALRHLGNARATPVARHL